jgi:RNA polymerase sigma factor (TIGR02999 family)
MSTPDQGNVTQILIDLSGDDRTAVDRLLPLIYNELKTLAHRQHLRFSGVETLNTTALVHEAYIKLVDHEHQNWKNRGHFFGVAAQAMRHILVDYVRARNSQKRGGGQAHVPLDEGLIMTDAEADDLLALDDALSSLEKLNPRQSRIVECRFFGGMTIEETAAVLDISTATVKRDWSLAQLWLFKTIQQDPTT